MSKPTICNFELVYYGGAWMGSEEPPAILAAILLGFINPTPVPGGEL